MSTIVGLDIGSSTIRAVEVQNAATAKPTITRVFEVPLPEGSVRRGEVIEVTTVATALRRLWSEGGFKAKDVALGMGGPRVFARDLMVPRAPLAQIRESLPFQVQELLPVPVDQALLDFYPISEETTDEGVMVDGLLVAAIKEAVTANVAAVTQAGLNPVHVDLIPFALTRAMTHARTPGYLVLVGIGANTTNVIVTHEGVPQFVRIIASGGDDITRALASHFELGHAQAETLKRTLGMGAGQVTAEDRAALEVIYGVIGELFTSIRSTLNYFTTQKKGITLDRLSISGGGAQLTGLAEALAESTGLAVERSAGLGAATLSRKITTISEEQQNSMSTAFGLALGTSA